MIWLRAILMASVLAAPALAQDVPEPPMTYERLGRILFTLDGNAQPVGRGFQLSISGVPMLVVTDPAADRMRAMVPLGPSEGLTAEELMRMIQANFDTALDARYAVAKGQLWAVFIHPLSPLKKDQLISSLGQTVNIARTYGTLYTGGALQFGGGDSPGIQRQLIEELLEKSEEI